jgi:hypothetical protein
MLLTQGFSSGCSLLRSGQVVAGLKTMQKSKVKASAKLSFDAEEAGWSDGEEGFRESIIFCFFNNVW